MFASGAVKEGWSLGGLGPGQASSARDKASHIFASGAVRQVGAGRASWGCGARLEPGRVEGRPALQGTCQASQQVASTSAQVAF